MQPQKRTFFACASFFVYFLSKAGQVDPAERPLSPPYDDLPSSSSLNKRFIKRRDCHEKGSYSMRRSALYFTTRSLRAGAPVLVCPLPSATTKSAISVFSVSPGRWETMTPQPSDGTSCALDVNMDC